MVIYVPGGPFEIEAKACLMESRINMICKCLFLEPQ
jgi:hypothetical protein